MTDTVPPAAPVAGGGEEAARLLAGVLDSALDGVVAYRAVRDRCGRIADFEYLLVNGPAGRIMARDPARLIGQRLLAEGSRFEREAGLFERYIEVVETGRRADLIHPHRGGGEVAAEARWFHTVAVKVGDDALAATFSDITALKAADRAVAESERRFRTVFDQTLQFVWLLDPNGRVIEANRTALDYCNLSRDDVVGRPFGATAWWPQDEGSRRRVDAALAAAARGERVRYEAEVRRAECNGDVMDFSVWPMLGAEGEVELLVAEGRDVSPRRNAEFKLRESRSLYRAIFEHIPIGLFLVAAAPGDGGFVVEALNPAAAALLGADAAAAVGRPVEGVFPPGMGVDLIERLRGCAARGEGLEYEGIGDLPVGRRDLRIGLAPVQGRGGQGGGTTVTRIIGRLMDVTERKQTEETLYHAQKMEAIGQLTGGIAHDFNNLLMVIGGNLELLEYQLAGQPERLPLIQKALDAVFRASALTQQLLAYSRKQRLNPEIVDCNQLVDGLRDMLRRTLGEAIEIKALTRANLWPCEVDRGQLETVLLNLAVNARDAMPDGGTLIIETDNVWLDDEDEAARAVRHPGLKPGPYVTIAITDTGHGIPPEVIDHVFEPFFTTKEVGKGSGLGLSMAYGFAQQSGGQIVIYSEPGGGTTLRLYLPRAARGADGTAAGERPGRPVGGPETILVVEDDPEVRRLAVSRLAGLGYRVLEAANGHAALAAVERHPEIDLLFTDLVMPGGMDGLAVVKQARRRRPGLKVLYTTGYPDRAVPRQRAISGRAQLLAKPYRLAELADKVRRALDVSPQR